MGPKPCWDAGSCFDNQDILLFVETVEVAQPLIHIFNQVNPSHILPSIVFKLKFNVVLPSLSRSYNGFFSTYLICIPVRVTCSVSYIILHFIILIIFGEE